MKKINNKGQILLIITIALATLLGIGLSVSNQTLSSITRTSQTDSLQKVTAAAEGGLEKYLLLNDQALIENVGKTNLVETFTASKTRAKITVSNLVIGNSGLSFPEVSLGQVANVHFTQNSDIVSTNFLNQEACLRITTDTPNADFMLNVIVQNPTQETFKPNTPSNVVNYDATKSNKFLMEKYIYKDGSWANSVKPEECATNSYKFKNTAILRIHPLSESLKNLKISVLNSSNIQNLNNVRQGFTIVSVGEFDGVDDKTTRRITATKFLDSPSYVFDYTAFIDY